MVDGSIKYKKSEGSIHKIAAKILGAESCNGWTYWHCNINGSTVVIDSLRQKFIAKNLMPKFYILYLNKKPLQKISFIKNFKKISYRLHNCTRKVKSKKIKIDLFLTIFARLDLS